MSGIELQVAEDIAARQKLGLAKYGVSVAENRLELRAWLQHAYEEALDLPVYLKRAIAELDAIFSRNSPLKPMPKKEKFTLHETPPALQEITQRLATCHEKVVNQARVESVSRAESFENSLRNALNNVPDTDALLMATESPEGQAKLASIYSLADAIAEILVITRGNLHRVGFNPENSSK